MNLQIFLLTLVSALEINLTNLQQVYYSMPVMTNNKTYNLIVDTGSQIMWINGNQTGKRNYFECDNCTLIQSPASIKYGVGEVKGNIYNNKFNIINQSMALNVLQVQEIESLNDLLADGLIGFNKPTQQNPDSFLQKLYDLKISNSRAFGLFLNDKNCQSNSVLTLGEPNKDHYYGELHYVDSSESDLWYFYSGSIEIAGNNKKITLEKFKQQMLLDSGTSKILFPKYRFDQLHNILNDDFGLDCEVISHNEFNELVCPYSENYPALFINVGNMSLSLVSQDYVQYCSYNYYLQQKCYLSFQQVDNTNEIILGVTFLQKYYTHYDGDNNRIGIAPSMNYQKDKLQLSQLGNQYNYNMLCFSLLFTAALLTSIYIIVRILLKKSIPLYLSVLEKSSSRSQEQEMEAITLKTSSNNQIS